MSCPKCTSTDLLVTFTAKGKVLDAFGRREVEDEFVTSSQYDYSWTYRAAKDYLHKHCRTCQYQWRENTADHP